MPPGNVAPYPSLTPPRGLRPTSPVDTAIMRPIRRRFEEANAFADGFQTLVTMTKQNQEQKRRLSLIDQIELLSNRDRSSFRRQVRQHYSQLKQYVTQIELLDLYYQLERMTARNHIVRFLRMEQLYLERIVHEAAKTTLGTSDESCKPADAKMIANALGAVIVSMDYFRRASGGRGPSPKFENPADSSGGVQMTAELYEELQIKRKMSRFKIPDFVVAEFYDLEAIVQALIESGTYMSTNPDTP